MPEFGQHLAIVAVGGEPSGVRSAGPAGQNSSEMVPGVIPVRRYIDAENESCPVFSVSSMPSFASYKSKAVGGLCFEVDEDAEPSFAISESPVQESGWEELGE